MAEKRKPRPITKGRNVERGTSNGSNSKRIKNSKIIPQHKQKRSKARHSDSERSSEDRSRSPSPSPSKSHSHSHSHSSNSSAASSPLRHHQKSKTPRIPVAFSLLKKAKHVIEECPLCHKKVYEATQDECRSCGGFFCLDCTTRKMRMRKSYKELDTQLFTICDPCGKVYRIPGTIANQNRPPTPPSERRLDKEWDVVGDSDASEDEKDYLRQQIRNEWKLGYKYNRRRRRSSAGGDEVGGMDDEDSEEDSEDEKNRGNSRRQSEILAKFPSEPSTPNGKGPPGSPFGSFITNFKKRSSDILTTLDPGRKAASTPRSGASSATGSPTKQSLKEREAKRKARAEKRRLKAERKSIEDEEEKLKRQAALEMVIKTLNAIKTGSGLWDNIVRIIWLYNTYFLDILEEEETRNDEVLGEQEQLATKFVEVDREYRKRRYHTGQFKTWRIEGVHGEHSMWDCCMRKIHGHQGSYLGNNENIPGCRWKSKPTEQDKENEKRRLKLQKKSQELLLKINCSMCTFSYDSKLKRLQTHHSGRSCEKKICMVCLKIVRFLIEDNEDDNPPRLRRRSSMHRMDDSLVCNYCRITVKTAIAERWHSPAALTGTGGPKYTTTNTMTLQQQQQQQPQQHPRTLARAGSTSSLASSSTMQSANTNNNETTKTECDLCFKEFTTKRKPKNLDCEHTLCVECIALLLNTQSSPIVCPSCRGKTSPGRFYMWIADLSPKSKTRSVKNSENQQQVKKTKQKASSDDDDDDKQSDNESSDESNRSNKRNSKKATKEREESKNKKKIQEKEESRSKQYLKEKEKSKSKNERSKNSKNDEKLNHNNKSEPPRKGSFLEKMSSLSFIPTPPSSTTTTTTKTEKISTKDKPQQQTRTNNKKIVDDDDDRDMLSPMRELRSIQDKKALEQQRQARKNIGKVSSHKKVDSDSSNPSSDSEEKKIHHSSKRKNSTSKNEKEKPPINIYNVELSKVVDRDPNWFRRKVPGTESESDTGAGGRRGSFGGGGGGNSSSGGGGGSKDSRKKQEKHRESSHSKRKA